MIDDMILYHGSRGGIVGEIIPSSLSRCDFGKGFYMGSKPLQAKALVTSDENPYFYKLEEHLSEILDSQILSLKDMEWAYFVLFHRGKLESVKGTPFYDYYENLDAGKDFIIGPNAVDIISLVISRFSKNEITDKALIESLRKLKYGMQYVAKTDFACSKVKILSEHLLDEDETIPLLMQSAENRRLGEEIIKNISRMYRRDGNYFDEILNSI